MSIATTVQNIAATPITLTVGQLVTGAAAIVGVLAPLTLWGIRTARRSAVNSAATLAAITRLERTAWTKGHQVQWIAELQQRNRDLDVPIPEAPDTPRPVFDRGDPACEA